MLAVRSTLLLLLNALVVHGLLVAVGQNSTTSPLYALQVDHNSGQVTLNAQWPSSALPSSSCLDWKTRTYFAVGGQTPRLQGVALDTSTWQSHTFSVGSPTLIGIQCTDGNVYGLATVNNVLAVAQIATDNSGKVTPIYELTSGVTYLSTALVPPVFYVLSSFQTHVHLLGINLANHSAVYSEFVNSTTWLNIFPSPTPVRLVVITNTTNGTAYHSVQVFDTQQYNMRFVSNTPAGYTQNGAAAWDGQNDVVFMPLLNGQQQPYLGGFAVRNSGVELVPIKGAVTIGGLQFSPF